MKRVYLVLLLTILTAVASVISCKRPASNTTTGNSNFPTEIGSIMINNCAVSGCHDAASYMNCNGLLLDTWEHLFNGGVSGASVVPYSPQYSPFLYFLNTDQSLGTVAQPTMPISTPGRTLPYLTSSQYQTIQNWIAAGAPDKNGNIAFSSNADTRQKIYVTQQGCDLVAVVDAQSRLVMRYIPVGMPRGVLPNSQSPHDVTISDDGMYGYVSLYNGSYLQKIDTRADTISNQVDLSGLTGGAAGGWSIVTLSHKDTAMLVSSFQSNGLVAYINPANLNVLWNLPFTNPHGMGNNATYDTFFAVSQYGNCVYKFSLNGLYPYTKQVSIDGNPCYFTTTKGVSPDPHQIEMSPDYSKYFVTCENTNEVRVMDAHADTLIKAIPVGNFPQEMDMSTTYPYLFVACMEDPNNPNAGRLGSVYVINYNTYQIVDVIYGDFYEPHDVTVDELYGQVFIISTNKGGQSSLCHVTACGGNVGWYSVYDLHSLQPADNKRYELTRVPYASNARF